MDGFSTTRDDFAYQLRSEGKTELAAKLEKDADNANQGYTPEINNPAVHPSLWNLGNLDFGRDYADFALRNFRNGHLLVGTVNLLDSASEIIVDFVLAMAGAAYFGAAVSSISTLITTGSLTTAYVSLEINLQNNLKIVNSNLQNLWNDVSNNFSLGVKSLTDKIKNVYSNTKFLKNIPLNKISNNPIEAGQTAVNIAASSVGIDNYYNQNRLFWSGWGDGGVTAEKFARENGMTTLEMTLVNPPSFLDNPKYWNGNNGVSANFAKTAQGDVTALLIPNFSFNYPGTNTFKDLEFGLLLNNSDITSINLIW